MLVGEFFSWAKQRSDGKKTANSSYAVYLKFTDELGYVFIDVPNNTLAAITETEHYKAQGYQLLKWNSHQQVIDVNEMKANGLVAPFNMEFVAILKHDLEDYQRQSHQAAILLDNIRLTPIYPSPANKTELLPVNRKKLKPQRIQGINHPEQFTNQLIAP